MSEWISVDERMPEDGVEVLVINKYGGYGVAYHWNDTRKNRFEANGGYWAFPEITHWMPLPAPPESPA